MNIAPEEMPREIARLEDENSMLKDYTKELEERINKAVEHIENIKKYGVYMVNGNDLLDILKGSDKEW